MNLEDYMSVSEAPHKDALRSALRAFADKMGFQWVNAVLVDGSLDSPGVKIGAVGTIPVGYMDAHFDRDAIRRDPVLRRLNGPTAPITYDQGFYVMAGAGDLWEEQAPFGYRVGLGASLPVGGGRHVLVGVDRHEKLPTSDVIRLRMLADLQLLVMHAHTAAVRLLDEPVPGLSDIGLPHLTVRELEVLSWASKGKSVADTATILGLSAHTVKNYMNSTLRKFGVATKLQAVMLANEYGML